MFAICMTSLVLYGERLVIRRMLRAGGGELAPVTRSGITTICLEGGTSRIRGMTVLQDHIYGRPRKMLLSTVDNMEALLVTRRGNESLHVLRKGALDNISGGRTSHPFF